MFCIWAPEKYALAVFGRFPCSWRYPGTGMDASYRLTGHVRPLALCSPCGPYSFGVLGCCASYLYLGQCATHVVPVAPNALSRRTTGKLGRCGWWVVILFVEDGAVGWSCKCSSGRHCRRIGGHQTTTWRLASCSLSRGHNLRLASPGARIQAARGLEFCVLGIVVHLRLGNCIGYSLREHECLYLRHVRVDVLVGHSALTHCGWFHYHVLAPSLEWFASWVS